MIHRGNRGQRQQKALFEKTVSSQHPRKLIIGFAFASINHGGNLLTESITHLNIWSSDDQSGFMAEIKLSQKFGANQRAHMSQRYASLKL